VSRGSGEAVRPGGEYVQPCFRSTNRRGGGDGDGSPRTCMLSLRSLPSVIEFVPRAWRDGGESLSPILPSSEDTILCQPRLWARQQKKKKKKRIGPWSCEGFLCKMHGILKAMEQLSLLKYGSQDLKRLVRSGLVLLTASTLGIE
jgi:hypothetical protein